MPINNPGGQFGEAYIHGMNGIAEGVRQVRGISVNQVLGDEGKRPDHRRDRSADPWADPVPLTQPRFTDRSPAAPSLGGSRLRVPG
ncbi:MAG: hypothetical protein L0H93_16600 [Nocardioides sp.]|nr:hypothetical protein [Nocardioides sp.]